MEFDQVRTGLPVRRRRNNGAVPDGRRRLKLAALLPRLRVLQSSIVCVATMSAQPGATTLSIGLHIGTEVGLPESNVRAVLV